MPVGLAHTLVAAHADRVRELARLWDALERAVAEGGVDGDAARRAHQCVGAEIDRWILADLEDERRDVVTLTEGERESLRRDLARAIAHAEGDTARALHAIEAALPVALSRATLVRVRRSAARLSRIEELGGPAFAVSQEARVMLGAFELASMPLVPAPIAFDPTNGFHDTLVRGLEACLIEAAGAAGGADLGLGTSPDVATLPASYPLVPRGRFCRVTPARLVRADLEGTGPIGWAAGDDVAGLGDALRALGGAAVAAAERVHAAAERGHAVIGLIEYLPPEAEGQRQWLSEPDAP